MDHAQEQEMELQAMEAIYADDYKKLDENTAGGTATFEVTLVPEAGAGEDVNHVCVAMRVAYTATYPEAPPELSLRAIRKGELTDEMIADFEKLLREAAASEELLGTPMVYGLGEKVKEWLVEHNKPELDMHSQMMARIAAAQKAQAEEDEAVDLSDPGADGGGSTLRGKPRKPGGNEAEGSWRADPLQQALTGEYTPVTPETFKAWKADFDARQAAAAASSGKGGAGAGGSSQNTKAIGEGSLTGRQLFEGKGGLSLIHSDGPALEDGEDDLMSSRAADDDDDDDEEDEDDDGGAAAAVLDTVGDEALFDEDEELPDDEDD